MNEDLLKDDKNREAYEYLTVSIEAKANRLNLLIGVCDDASFRDEIIAQYEAELQPQIHCYRTTLARGEPSLTAAISQLIRSEEYLQQHNPAVISVTGAEQLYLVKQGKERSEKEVFFGYLQWTREALRAFPFAIVLWVTNEILVELIKKAPDFWSWRNGVFRFAPIRKNTVSARELEPIRFVFRDNELSGFDDDNDYLLPIEDLQGFIQDLEQRGAKDKTLATLYFSLGDIYRRRLERSEFQNYKKEQELGIKYLSKAVELQKQLGLEKDLATSLNNLAYLYRSQGRYSEAETLFLQALLLKRKLLGEEQPSIASSLNNLASLYESQGKYSEAEPLYRQALEMRQRLLGKEHPDVAQSLNNLALLYTTQGRYNESEPLHRQALEMKQRLLGQEHPDVATSLNNLASLYESQGRYSEAEPLYRQALEMRQRLLGNEHPDVAQSLNNLALLYTTQGKYNEAEPLHHQALEMRQRLLQQDHPDVATSLNNLALFYTIQRNYTKAEFLYSQALEILERRLGVNHPNTITCRKNLAYLRDRLSSES
ncbi:tetratricopeptide repeat protein [Nostoc spongiaeforme FACHB-130]|uniref:Tetratricopeptide repeat protein n=1 Tax=Nostoc spongiaeforme FACHB-130 TaxID=1357510 RepID=A0ABR8G4B5_9NOSO|nr:tetratricopeptide repeat protein [Nostoc spongiaeforme]MBD2598067.1 tetratricopeptide repeat protein [Nostoc spongiaeforme FACHB-130]